MPVIRIEFEAYKEQKKRWEILEHCTHCFTSVSRFPRVIYRKNPVNRGKYLFPAIR